MIVDPTQSALNLFVGFFSCMPLSIRAIVSLSIVLFCVTSTFKFIWDVRH